MSVCKGYMNYERLNRNSGTMESNIGFEVNYFWTYKDNLFINPI